MINYLNERINTHTDNLQNAIIKKSNNKSLSGKSLSKLIKITNTQYEFKNGEAKFIFEHTPKITTINIGEVIRLINDIKSISIKKSDSFINSKIDLWVSNAQKLPSSNNKNLIELYNALNTRNEIFNKIKKLTALDALKKSEQKKLDRLYLKKYGYDRKINKYELQYDISHGIGVQFKNKYFPPQRGEHCKLSALALIDAFFSDAMGKDNIPLLKEKKASLSIRQIAKKLGSIQGEVLQIDTLSNIAKIMGYNVNIVRAESASHFSECIEKNLSENKGVITFYSVGDENPYWIKQTPNDYLSENFEHATVISKYDRARNICTTNHWGKKYLGVPTEILFNSGAQLMDTRATEFYDIKFKSKRNLHTDNGRRGNYKYDIIPDINSVSDRPYRDGEFMKTMTPAPGSGFKSAIIILEPDKTHQRWLA